MIINENVNLAFTLLVSTNVRLIKEINYNKIIKRFSQVGPKGTKIAEKMAENVSKTSVSASNPDIPHVTSTQQNPNKGLQKYSSNKNENQSHEKSNTIPNKSTTSKSPNQTSKNNFEDKIKNSSKKSKENEDANETNKSINKFITNEKIREDNKNQIPYKEKVINEFFSEEENSLPEKPKLKEESEPRIIAINLKPKNPTNLTSEEKHNFGQPQNTRVSDTKIDGTYIPEKEKTPGIDDQGNKIQIKREIRIPANDNEDGGGMAVPSITKGGQHVRKLHEPLKLEKEEYEVNKIATEYTQENASIYKIVVDKHKEVTEENIAKNIYVEKYSEELNEEYDE